MNARLAQLKERAEAAIGRARQIADTAEKANRDFTVGEKSGYDAAVKEAEDILRAIKSVKADEQILDDAESFAKCIGGNTPAYHPGTGTLMDAVGIGGNVKHIGLAGVHGKALARKITADISRRGVRTDGAKAQAVLGVPSDPPLFSTVIEGETALMSRPAASLLDVLPARIVNTVYRTMRQTSRDMSAITGPTASGDKKPVLGLGLQSKDQRLRVLAVTTDPVDEYGLKDVANLEGFIHDELVYAVRHLWEKEIITGDGSDEHVTGILNTSGIVLQPFATDILTSIRKAITTLQVSAYDGPNTLIYLSPSDWEFIELLTSSAAAVGSFRNVAVDPIERRLFGFRVVLAQGGMLPAKTGLVIGDGSVLVDTDGVMDVAAGQPSDSFQRNEVVFRAETRGGLTIGQPQAIVKVGTAA